MSNPYECTAVMVYVLGCTETWNSTAISCMKKYTIERHYVDAEHDDETVNGSLEKTLGDKARPFFVLQEIIGQAVVQSSQRKSRWSLVFGIHGNTRRSPALENVSSMAHDGTLIAKINSGKKPGFDQWRELNHEPAQSFSPEGRTKE